MTINLYILVLS